MAAKDQSVISIGVNVLPALEISDANIRDKFECFTDLTTVASVWGLKTDTESGLINALGQCCIPLYRHNTIPLLQATTVAIAVDPRGFFFIPKTMLEVAQATQRATIGQVPLTVDGAVLLAGQWSTLAIKAGYVTLTTKHEMDPSPPAVATLEYTHKVVSMVLYAAWGLLQHLMVGMREWVNKEKVNINSLVRFAVPIYNQLHVVRITSVISEICRYASRAHAAELLRAVLINKGDPNMLYTVITAFGSPVRTNVTTHHVIILTGETECTHLLIANRANVDVAYTSSSNETLLGYAIAHQRNTLVRMLLAAGVDVTKHTTFDSLGKYAKPDTNCFSGPPLERAIRCLNSDAFNMLIVAGAPDYRVSEADFKRLLPNEAVCHNPLVTILATIKDCESSDTLPRHINDALEASLDAINAQRQRISASRRLFGFADVDVVTRMPGSDVKSTMYPRFIQIKH